MVRFLALLIMAGFPLPASAASHAGVEYGRAGGYSLRMDAYVPDGPGPFPAAIIVHGGGWVGGDRKRSVDPLFQPLADAKVAWFSISYRLANFANHKSTPTAAATMAMLGGAVDDVRKSVAYVRGHAAEYRVNPDQIVLIGESAGAQLASMAALKPGPEGTVKAVVAFYLPSDLVTLVNTMPLIPDSVRQAVKGTLFEDLLNGYLREMSPTNAIHPGEPPFLLIHGTADQVVPFQQSVDLCNKIRKAGSECEVYPVEGGRHGLLYWESSKDQTAYKSEMVLWLKNHL